MKMLPVRKCFIFFAATIVFAAPSMSFDGEYNFNNDHSHQYQGYPGQSRQRNEQQQYSYGGPQSGYPRQSGYGTRNDTYSTPSVLPPDPAYVAPASRNDGGEQPRRRRHHGRERDDGDTTSPSTTSRRSSHRWRSRDHEETALPRRTRRHRAVRGDDDDEPRRRAGRYQTGISGVPGYGSVVACVRRCDGSFFPVGQFSSLNLDAQEALCKGLCPSAETELYLIPPGGDGVSTAVSRQGVPYSKMPHALLYTKKREAACTCHGISGQARLVSMMKDFTMRRGDAVMTPKGLQIFLGASRWPYREADFQVLDKAKYILKNGLALAEVEKATKPLQAQTHAREADEDDDGLPGDDDEPTFVTGVNGKQVRVIGDLQVFGPPQKSPPKLASPAALSLAVQVAPSASAVAAAAATATADPPAATAAATASADPPDTGSIVPLWRPRAVAR